MRVFVSGVSVWGPGLPGWVESRAVLRGEEAWTPGETLPPAPSILAANERRRTGAVVRLALAVAQEATAMSGIAASALRCVFGSSNGDGPVVHEILEAISTPGYDVSPTQFHNSVHNAAAGYWTIGTGTRQAASCLGCHDSTWGLSLLKAAAEVRVEQVPLLLCVYDRPIPPPMAEKRPTEGWFGVALVLTPEQTAASFAALSVEHATEPATLSEMRVPGLAALARGNAAAQSLGLLQLLARGEAGSCPAPCLEGSVHIEVSPCSTAPAS